MEKKIIISQIPDTVDEAERHRLRVAAYCRVSRDSDAQDGSFEMQMEYYRDYINSRPDYILIGIYGDYGKSGRSVVKRTELNRLLNDCREGKVDLILTKSVSRFARNLPECVAMVRELKAMHVAVYFEKENLNTGDEKNELLLSILATIAQEESNSIGQNLSWARKKHCEMGQPWERARYGYRSIGKEHRWVVQESEAVRVRLAFYLAGSGSNYREIMAALNELEEVEQTGRVWNNTPVRNLLTSVVYIGDYLSNKEIRVAAKNGVKRRKNRGEEEQIYIEEHHEPLVGRELFEKVQELVKRGLLNSRRIRFSEEDRRILEACRQLAEKEMENDGRDESEEDLKNWSNRCGRHER